MPTKTKSTSLSLLVWSLNNPPKQTKLNSIELLKATVALKKKLSKAIKKKQKQAKFEFKASQIKNRAEKLNEACPSFDRE